MHRFTLLILWVLTLLSLSACDRPPVPANVKDVITEASVVRLYGLQPSERKNLNRCCRYIGVDPNNRKKFSPQQGYWVRLTIHNKKLAQASLLNSCGPSLRPQNCEPAPLKQKIQEAFKTNQYSAMYGKGLTRFILYDGQGNKIDKTEKHDGHIIASLKRDGDMDYFTIGPVNIKPATVAIFMSTSLQEFKYDIESAQ